MLVRIGSMLLSSLITFALDTERSYIIAICFIVCIMRTIAVRELEHKQYSNYTC
jgi:cytochrome c biogenesis factor